MLIILIVLCYKLRLFLKIRWWPANRGSGREGREGITHEASCQFHLPFTSYYDVCETLRYFAKVIIIKLFIMQFSPAAHILMCVCFPLNILRTFESFIKARVPTRISCLIRGRFNFRVANRRWQTPYPEYSCTSVCLDSIIPHFLTGKHAGWYCTHICSINVRFTATILLLLRETVAVNFLLVLWKW